MARDVLPDAVQIGGDLRVFDNVKVALKLLPKDFSQLCFLSGSEEKFCGIRYLAAEGAGRPAGPKQ